MLTILLKILSILGIAALAVLGVALTVILLVLFVPVSYRIKAERRPSPEEGPPEADQAGDFGKALTRVAVNARWLFGFLRVCFYYPDPGTLRAKALFFTLYDSGKPKTAVQEDAPKKNAPPKQNDESGSSSSGAKDASMAEDTGEKSSAARRDVADEPSSDPFAKLQYTFHKLCDKIREIRENTAYYREILLDEDTKGLLHHALMRLGKILRSIRPRKLRADVRFGTGSPDTTGYAFGVYGMLCAYLGKNVLLTPDFERAVLEGELFAAGHVTVCRLLWHGVMVALDKRLWELVSKLKKEK